MFTSVRSYKSIIFITERRVLKTAMAFFGLSIFRAVLIFVIPKADGAHIHATEPEVTWTPPADVSSFETYNIGANYTGLLWAGRNEFPWLVELRSADSDQEYWSVGNLASYHHVLTSCRAVDILQGEANVPSEKYSSPSEYNWSKEIYRQSSDIRVYYCRDFLWADGVYDTKLIDNYDSQFTGWRAPKEIIRHELCHLSRSYVLLYDVAVIVLNRGIPPIPPRLSYMPTGYDYSTDKIKEMVILDPKRKISYRSPLCYVASFGRNSINNKEYYTLDYKVKYRVYLTAWKDCVDRWKYICPAEDCKDPKKYESAGKNAPMCLRPRARVGTVCDHDKGAPLVCNGQVIGLVIRAAKFHHCNNNFKIPFVVEKIDHYRKFFDDSVSYAVQPVKGSTASTTNARGGDEVIGHSATLPTMNPSDILLLLTLLPLTKLNL